MNERIRELAKQARQIGEYVNYGQIRLSPEQFEQKFAELIVRDCISQIAMIGVSNFENDDVGWTVDKSIENIRKHFGVKE